MKYVRLIARREFLTQVRTRAFTLSMIGTIAVVAALVVVPQLISSESKYRVGLVGPSSQVIKAPGESIANESGIVVEFTSPRSAEAAKTALTDKELDAVVIDSKQIFTNGSIDRELSSVLQAAHQTGQLSANLTKAGLSEANLATALNVSPLSESSITADSDSTVDGAKTAIVSLIMAGLMFLFMTNTVGLAYSIVEEKSSRIVEILLVAVKPWQLLVGKMLAFGVIGALQLCAYTVTALVAATAVGATEKLPSGMPGIIAVTFTGYVLGYLCFGAMAASLGSLVSRQEETNSTLAPMTAATILSYIGAYVSYEQPGTTLGGILAVVPPVSSIALPVNLVLGNASVGQVILSLALMVLLVVVLLTLAGRIYGRSVLQTGARLKLKDALRS